MLGTDYTNTTLLHLGLLIVRSIVGFGIAAHGAQKLFGMFGGYGLEGTGGFMESLGFRPGVRYAFMAGMAEFTGGMLLALGLAGPIGPALIMVTMIVAIGTVHKGRGFFAANNGWELPLMFASGALAFALLGPGRYSLDFLLDVERFWTPARIIAVVAAALIAAVVSLAVLRKRHEEVTV